MNESSKRIARNVFLSDVMLLLPSSNIVDLDDVGVDKRSRRSSFLQESLDVILRSGQIRPHNFQGDVSLQLFVKSQIDVGHPARTKPMEDAIAVDDAIG